VTVKRGDVVTWVNDGTTMQSDVLGPGDSFATLFETAGTFTYRSTVAGDAMSGTVVVEAGPLPTTTGPTPPTGTVPEGFEPGPGITGTTTDAVTPQPDESDRPTALLVAGVAAAVVVAAALLAAWLVRRRRRPRRAPRYGPAGWPPSGGDPGQRLERLTNALTGEMEPKRLVELRQVHPAATPVALRRTTRARRRCAAPTR